MTPRMKKFINHNSKVLIVEGQRVTKKGKPVITGDDFKQSDRCRYRFKDGSTRTLRDVDKQTAPHFSPDWDI